MAGYCWGTGEKFDYARRMCETRKEGKIRKIKRHGKFLRDLGEYSIQQPLDNLRKTDDMRRKTRK